MLQAPSTQEYANAHTHSIRQTRSLAQPCVKQKMLLQRKPKTRVKLRGIGYFLPTAKTPDGKKATNQKCGYNGPEVRWIFR